MVVVRAVVEELVAAVVDTTEVVEVTVEAIPAAKVVDCTLVVAAFVVRAFVDAALVVCTLVVVTALNDVEEARTVAVVEKVDEVCETVTHRLSNRRGNPLCRRSGCHISRLQCISGRTNGGSCCGTGPANYYYKLMNKRCIDRTTRLP